jgi:hypothetical protein
VICAAICAALHLKYLKYLKLSFCCFYCEKCVVRLYKCVVHLHNVTSVINAIKLKCSLFYGDKRVLNCDHDLGCSLGCGQESVDVDVDRRSLTMGVTGVTTRGQEDKCIKCNKCNNAKAGKLSFLYNFNSLLPYYLRAQMQECFEHVFSSIRAREQLCKTCKILQFTILQFKGPFTRAFSALFLVCFKGPFIRAFSALVLNLNVVSINIFSLYNHETVDLETPRVALNNRQRTVSYEFSFFHFSHFAHLKVQNYKHVFYYTKCICYYIYYIVMFNTANPIHNNSLGSLGSIRTISWPIYRLHLSSSLHSTSICGLHGPNLKVHLYKHFDLQNGYRFCTVEYSAFDLSCIEGIFIYYIKCICCYTFMFKISISIPIHNNLLNEQKTVDLELEVSELAVDPQNNEFCIEETVYYYTFMFNTSILTHNNSLSKQNSTSGCGWESVLIFYGDKCVDHLNSAINCVRCAKLYNLKVHLYEHFWFSSSHLKVQTYNLNSYEFHLKVHLHRQFVQLNHLNRSTNKHFEIANDDFRDYLNSYEFHLKVHLQGLFVLQNSYKVNSFLIYYILKSICNFLVRIKGYKKGYKSCPIYSYGSIFIKEKTVYFYLYSCNNFGSTGLLDQLSRPIDGLLNPQNGYEFCIEEIFFYYSYEFCIKNIRLQIQFGLFNHFNLVCNNSSYSHFGYSLFCIEEIFNYSYYLCNVLYLMCNISMYDLFLYNHETVYLDLEK